MTVTSLLTCTNLLSGRFLSTATAAMLHSVVGSLGCAAHDVHGKRALVDTLAAAHRLHAATKSKTEVLRRTTGCNAAQRDMLSVAAAMGCVPCHRADALLCMSGSTSSRRGHSTIVSSSRSNSSSDGGRVTSLQAASSISDLRSVPGIGPKNEQLLLASGHASLDALQQHFSKDVREDTVAMSEYLRVRSCHQLVGLYATAP